MDTRRIFGKKRVSFFTQFGRLLLLLLATKFTFIT